MKNTRLAVRILVGMICGGLYQSLFISDFVLPVYSLQQELEERSRQIREELETAHKKNKTLGGIVNALKNRQLANEKELKNSWKILSHLKSSLAADLKSSRKGKLNFLEEADMEEKGEKIDALARRIEELKRHQLVLRDFEARYLHEVIQMQNLVGRLEQEQMEIFETAQYPEFKAGGRANPDAVISPDTRIPKYKSRSASENPEVQTRQELDHKVSENPENSECTDQAENINIKSSAISGLKNTGDPDQSPNQNNSDQNLEESACKNRSDLSGREQDFEHGTGGIRKKTSFSKACPAPMLTAGDYDMSLEFESGDWIMPVQGVISAGTWAYGSGGLHLGLDMASSMFTPVRAPAAGIIIYADNPVDSNCGYLGNYSGWPYGGGNTIAMLCVVNGQVFCVTFCHLSSTLYVSPGQQVNQSDIIALSGNSGNSTGPHTHIEVIALSLSLEQAVQVFSNGADFAFGCGWDAPATCSSYGCRIRPESVFFQLR